MIYIDPKLYKIKAFHKNKTINDSIFTLKTYFSINILQNPEKYSKYDIFLRQSDHYIAEKYVFLRNSSIDHQNRKSH